MPRIRIAAAALALACLSAGTAEAGGWGRLQFQVGRLDLSIEPRRRPASWAQGAGPQAAPAHGLFWAGFEPPVQRPVSPLAPPPPTSFERSLPVRIARVFLDSVPAAEIGPIRVRLKIILE